MIIVDSTEPVGPAKVLFTEEFFAACQNCLTPGGVFIGQNGLPFLYPEHLAESGQHPARPVRRRRLLHVHPAGLFRRAVRPGLGRQRCRDARRASTAAIAERYAASGIKTRYYNPEVHTASFVLPNYVAEAWAGAAG